MKFYQQLKPVHFPEANNVIGARDATAVEKQVSNDEEIGGLPILHDGIQYMTCWRAQSWRARLYFLFTGKVWFVQLHTLTPNALGIGDPFDRGNSQ